MATTESTELRASVKIPHDMRPALDAESRRYALGCLNIVPIEPDAAAGVYAIATDGRIMAIVPCEGFSDAPHLVPAEVLPQKRAHWPKHGKPHAELNGKWESSFGTFAQEPEGRFPKCADIIDGTQVTCETHYRVSLNPELLWNLAQALGHGESGRAVTLFIPNNDPKGTKPIKVLGNAECGGFGVIMPCELDEDQDQFAGMNSKTNAYAKSEQAAQAVT